MTLRFVEIGTELMVIESNDDSAGQRCLSAAFYELASYLSFWAESEDLYNMSQQSGNTAKFKISFFRETNMYSFTGRVRETKLKDGHFLTKIDQITEMIVSSRRASHRHAVTISTRLYESVLSKNAMDALLSGQITDISSDGVCLLSNDSFDSDFYGNDHLYVLEFTIGRNERFQILSRLKRRESCSQSVQYKYTYGFEFDFSDEPKDKYRLIIALFQYKS